MKGKITAKKIIGGVTTALLVCAFVLALVCLCSVWFQTLRNGEASLFGYKMYHVESDSMYPTLEKGDMIISKALKNTDDHEKIDKQVNMGDVVTFTQVIKGVRINNTHRVVKDVYYDEEMGEYCILTKGDNPSAPQDAPLPISNLKAKMVKKTTFLQNLYSFLGSTGGIAIVIILPMGLLFASTIFQLVQKIRKPAEAPSSAPQKTQSQIEEEIKRKAVEEYIKEQAIAEYLRDQNKEEK